MVSQIRRGKHIAVLDNPVNGRTLPTLAVVEEFVRLGFRVTYVTSAEVASRLALLDPDRDSWCAVGFLDDSVEPVATVRGYFHEDRPDLVVYCTNTCATAERLLVNWRVPAAHLISGVHERQVSAFGNSLHAHVREFLARHGLHWAPHDDFDSWVLALDGSEP
ncbi:hypothetical protein [Lentzea albida]|uniref:Uncharacterized protein n=1 Tax=Lentzea albida TaxID=65499 RepID=A0A1H9WTZ4_9PSEU|nr:hypothetical protein [Lentzea albida]SES37271.1 hypothetical protein SAMN04488000_124110 [Lentzea albida]